jgi:soluble lytic murein transglycosylase-like protein
MQLMPKTAGALPVANPFYILSNATGGCEYFRRLLTEFGSNDLALAAYNAGPANVKKYGGIPPFRETRAYVAKLCALRKVNKAANL